MLLKLRCPNINCNNKTETFLDIEEFPKAIKCNECKAILVLNIDKGDHERQETIK
jgi:hypothetical protein